MPIIIGNSISIGSGGTAASVPSVTYSWQDASSNVLSTSPRLPLNVSDVGKDVSLKVNASDYAGNAMTEKVYSFGTVTNTGGLSDHFYDKRDEIMFWDFSQEITGDYITPLNTDNPAYSFADINGTHKLVTVVCQTYDLANFDSSENGFLKTFRRIQFPKAIGKRDYLFVTVTMRFNDAQDDGIFTNFMEFAGVPDSSYYLTHDTSQDRINMGGGSLYRLNGITAGVWVTYTMMWLDNTPTTASVVKIIATVNGTAVTPLTRTSTLVPTLDLQDKTGISLSSITQTQISSVDGDIKHFILPSMTGTLLTESEITTIHNQAHNAI